MSSVPDVPHEIQHPAELRRSGSRVRENPDHLTARDKLQPVLLDRLTDHAPDILREPPQQMQLSHSALRRSVLRDLQWLFNCVNSEAQQDLSAFPHVRRSTVNFGVAPLAGKRLSDIEWPDLKQKITDAILNFEPRIIPQGLQVSCLSDPSSLDLHNILSIELKGHLWCVPYPLEFQFRTEVDLENGYFTLNDSH